MLSFQLCQEWIPHGRSHHELWRSAETVPLTSTRRNLVEFNLFMLIFITHFPSPPSQQKSNGGIGIQMKPAQGNHTGSCCSLIRGYSQNPTGIKNVYLKTLEAAPSALGHCSGVLLSSRSAAPGRLRVEKRALLSCVWHVLPRVIVLSFCSWLLIGLWR